MTNRELETRYMHMKQTWKTLVEANVNLVDENKDLKEEIERLKNTINKAIEFIETEYNTYPSAEEWREALLQVLKGEKNV